MKASSMWNHFDVITLECWSDLTATIVCMGQVFFFFEWWETWQCLQCVKVFLSLPNRRQLRAIRWRPLTFLIYSKNFNCNAHAWSWSFTDSEANSCDDHYPTVVSAIGGVDLIIWEAWIGAHSFSLLFGLTSPVDSQRAPSQTLVFHATFIQVETNATTVWNQVLLLALVPRKGEGSLMGCVN